MDTKKCTRCEGDFPVESYHYSNKSRGIRKSVCKNCSYIYAQESIAKDPIAYYHYMKRYMRENPERYPGNHISKSIPTECGVYKISCVLTDDSYIGCSSNIRDRIYKHRKAYGRGKQQNLYKLIREYGWEAFDVEVLELCDRKMLFVRETHYIQEHKPNLNNNKTK